MTLTPAPPRPTEQDRSDALIREARRLQRRRHRRLAVIVVVLVTVAAAFAALHGGGGGAPVRPPLPPRSSPAVQTVNRPELGVATSYRLTGPLGVAVDGAGNVYLADGNRVLEVDHATRMLLVVAGTGMNGFSGDGGSALRARLSEPRSVAVGPNGDVYFVDNDRVRMVSAATGVISTVAGNGRAGSSGDGGPAVRARLDLDTAGDGSNILNEPLAIAPNGDLYIADGGNHEIRKVFHTTGIITSVVGDWRSGSAGSGATQRGALCTPLGVALDRASNVLIATACGSILEVSAATGLISTILLTRPPVGSIPDPVGLAVNDGKLYAAEAYGRKLLEIALDTGAVRLVAGTGEQTLQRPHGNAGDGGLATKATFGLSIAVTTDRQGNVYVADFFNNAIRRIDARTGVIDTVAGRIPTSPAHCC